MIITPRTRNIVVGVTIEFNSDEISHMTVALADYIRLMKDHGNLNGGRDWPWIVELKNKLDVAREEK